MYLFLCVDDFCNICLLVIDFFSNRSACAFEQHRVTSNLNHNFHTPSPLVPLAEELSCYQCSCTLKCLASTSLKKCIMTYVISW